ncbi:hypothetical protein [Cognatiluteimonas profundi]|uniref:hypothetical protein n=1 Tax=Cognatiluteimonas profundi TaxID=2594501 RepID=UPI00131B7530|nr:hypothetical protein [Lysobacter profundi]
MGWRREALEERLGILQEQLHEQLASGNTSVVEWLESQISDLMAVAVASGYADFVAEELHNFKTLASITLLG